MAISHGTITATTTPQVAYTADGDGCYILFHNDGTAADAVRLGTASISTTAGFELGAQEAMQSVRLGPNESLYVVAEANTVACSWLVHSD